MDIINNYNKKAQKLESYVPDDYCDVLGEILHEMEFQNQWRGQFFTPQHVCNMMGLICFDEGMLKAEVERRGFVTMNEPAIGAGALIYGAMNAMKRYGLYGLSAIIRHQNSLTGARKSIFRQFILNT